MTGYIGVLLIVGLVGFSHVTSSDTDRTEALPEAQGVSGESVPNGDIDGVTLDQWSAPYRGWHYWPDHVIPAKPKISGYECFTILTARVSISFQISPTNGS